MPSDQQELFQSPPQQKVSDIPASDIAPIWLQRMSLFVLVGFCFYLGVVLLVLPWLPLWTENRFLAHFPGLIHWFRMGAVRGIVSGLGLLDLWIGASEAIHYREYRA